MEDMDARDSEDGGEPNGVPEETVMGGEEVTEAGGEGSVECELGRMTGLILGVVGAELDGEMYFTGM